MEQTNATSEPPKGKEHQKKFLKNKKDGRFFAAKDAAKDTEEYTINTWKIERAKKKQEWRKRNNDIKARIKKESGNIDPELKKFSPYKKERQVKKLFKKKKVGRYFHAEDAGKNTNENTIKSRKIEKAKRIQDLKKRNDENKARINKESGDNDPGLKKSSPYKKERQVKKLVTKKKVGRYFNAENAGKNNEEKTTKSWKIERVKKKQEWRKRNDDKKAGINKESGENDPELKKSLPNKKEREVKKKDFIRKRKPHQKHDKRQKGEDDTMENKRDPVSGPKPIPKKTIRKHERGEGIRNKKDFIRKRKPHQKHDKRQKGDDTMENKRDPFPGPKPIPKETIRKYERGEGIRNPQTKSEFESKLLKRKEEKLKYVAKQAARAELIMQEESGFLRAEANEDTEAITQHDIADVVDVTSAQKFFELKMNDFGPYRINYTRNGRFLLFGGAKGHVAAIDWMTKKLLCEINVMETLHDVRWLHQETMYAVAQKQWTYIYDNQGIELHCLKVLDRVLRMEFLPYHFLLATANVTGYLSYIDVSVGEKVAGYSTQMGRLDVMCQNPSNAVIHLGHTGGTVSLWCPKVKEPLVKMLCHGSGVRSIAIDKTGKYMASSGIDRTLKIWDLRTYKTLQSYKLGGGAGQLAFSQTGLLAAGLGNIVQVYQDCIRQTVTKPYMVHNLTSSVNSLQFCPYEDVLGVGHGNGFSSLIIPGAGEANFDALEANPYQTKKQRREAEVKMLLDKIPADMIHIDSGIIGRVDQKTLQDKIEERNKNILFKPQKKDFQPKYKMKGRSKTGKYEQRKKGVIEQDKRTQIKDRVRLKQKEEREKQQNETRTLPSGNVLDRFKRKET